MLDGLHPRVGDGAAVDRHDLVRAVCQQTEPAIGSHRVPHPSTPAQAVLVAGDRLDHDVDLEPGQPVQLLADDSGLEPALGLQ